MAHPYESDHGKRAFSNLPPVAANSALGKVRAANAGKTDTQVENNTAAALGVTPPAKKRYNQR